MLETLLNYGEEAKTTHFQDELHFKDSAEAIKDMDTNGENDGFLECYKFSKGSKNIEMMGRLYHDIFTTREIIVKQSRFKYYPFMICKWILFV